MERGGASVQIEVAPLPMSARYFDVEGLAAHAGAIVIVDAEGVMLWTNPAWRRFAEENQGAEVLARHGTGTLYYDGIAGPLRDYYEGEFEVAARSGQVFEQVYECSTPDLRRVMRLRALPLPERGLLLEHSCVWELHHDRPEAVAQQSLFINEHGQIVQCGNCRRVLRASAASWDWVPAWLTHRPAPTSHAICEVCVGFYWGRRLHDARARGVVAGEPE